MYTASVYQDFLEGTVLTHNKITHIKVTNCVRGFVISLRSLTLGRISVRFSVFQMGFWQTRHANSLLEGIAMQLHLQLH